MDLEQQFERIVNSIGDPEAPREEHRRELRKRVLAAVQSGGPSIPITLYPQKRRFMMSNALIRWSAAAAVLLVCAALVLLYVGNSPSAAWADVSKNLNRAQTLSFKMTVYQGEELRQEQLLFLNADRMRLESEGSVGIFDWAQGKMLSLVPEYKQAVAATLTDAEPSGQRDWLADLKEIVGSKHAMQIGAKTIEDRLCKGWQVSNSMGTTTVWADEKTAEIVRVEIKEGIVRTVMSHFMFNPNIEESQFSLEVPEGYEMLADFTFAVKDACEDDVAMLLRAWAGGNGGVFPNSLMNVADWFKAASKYDWSKEKQDENTLEKAIGRAFFRLNSMQDWVYRGKGIKVGDAEEAVFWMPIGNDKYRVIYGDLSVREVGKKELPEPPSPATATPPAKE